eukprot:CAMPEP_0184016546 /NCGR_PEP_ID=MMETSP0954-20121128/6990_1 /TAXON_ID=627963 /ORGANISM="Aplanochytrium sp, Strain PBS07" /LENGTH=250 /DNA_ID=CAMNT_0026297581 /DNA_START=220 /DNA_END=969 /DNA_ORIENTATION=-
MFLNVYSVALAYALASLVSVTAAFEDGLVQLEGSTLHFPQDLRSTLTLEDIGHIVTREFGIEVFSKEEGSNLPTGDIFNRPKANLLLVIEGVGKRMIEEHGESEFPNLYNYFFQGADNTQFKLDAPASNFHLTCLEESLLEEFPDSMIHKMEGSFDMFHQVLGSLDEKAVNDDYPDLFVFTVNSPGETKLHVLEREMGKLFDSFNSLYGSRLSKNVVLLGQESGAHRRQLSTTFSNAEGYEGADFILVTW